MKTLAFPLFMIFLSLSQLSLYAQSEWTLRKEENGIKAYTRQVPGSKFEAYKVETIAEGTLEDCISVLHDASTYVELFEDSKENKLVEKITDAHIITYVHTNLPFPVRDRDGYYENKFEYLADEEKVLVKFSCLDGYEQKKRVVRLKYCSGDWEFKKLDDSRVKITHSFHTDPKGAIPAWLVNKKTIDSPLHTISAFRRLLKDPKYDGQSFDFMK